MARKSMQSFIDEVETHVEAGSNGKVRIPRAPITPATAIAKIEKMFTDLGPEGKKKVITFLGLTEC